MEQHEFDDLIATLEQKAQNGDSLAMKHLGDAYYQGASGKEKNVAAAFPYWKKAADMGDYSVAQKVGYSLMYGNGCQKDEKLGLSYFVKAANAGQAESQFYVAEYYAYGIGCEKNVQTAKQYYRAAALQGHGEAQWRLGSIQFLEKDHEAFHWISCAYLSGVKDAVDFINDSIHDGKDHQIWEAHISEIKQYGINPQNIPGSSSGNSGSDGGGCYIATAVYGSYDSPQVVTLRQFRDQVLSKSIFGRLFIRIYYRISPPIAEKLKNAKTVNQWVRKLLDRFVKSIDEN